MTPPPKKPVGMNGDHDALWEFSRHINGRVDRLYVTMTAGLGVLVLTLHVGILNLVQGGG